MNSIADQTTSQTRHHVKIPSKGKAPTNTRALGALKRITVWAYDHHLLSLDATQWIFDHLPLRSV